MDVVDLNLARLYLAFKNFLHQCTQCDISAHFDLLVHVFSTNLWNTVSI